MTDYSGVIWPLTCLGAGAFGVYLLARLITRRNDVLASATALCLGAAGIMLVPVWRRTQVATSLSLLPTWGLAEGGAFLRAEPAGLVVAATALGLGVMVAVYSGRYLSLDQRYETYYPLLLLLVAGLVGMVLTADLFNLYMFCELMSVACYVLVSFRRRTDTAIEAGFKYLIMGSAGTLLFLMGISFIYRVTGDLAIPRAMTASRAMLTDPWARLGLAFVIVGLGIKSALVPLHTWLPDAHGRAPSSISAMLSGIVIQSTLYVLLKVTLGIGFPARTLGTVLMALSIPSMTVGNTLALVQRYGKRLLAYSTIANVGYLLLAVGVGLRYGVAAAIEAGFFLLIVHAAMKGLAFLGKGSCHFYEDAITIDQLQGTSQRLPVVALTFGLALASLASIPPLPGFTAKWFILTTILQAGDALGLVGVIFFLLNGLIGLGYYLPLIANLFTPTPGPAPANLAVSRWMATPLVLLAGLLLAMGVHPAPWLTWLSSASAYLMTLGGG